MKSNEKTSSKAIQEVIEEKMDTPVIPEIVYELLPEILKKGCDQFKVNRERDIFLLGSLASLSGAMPNVFGFYDRKKIYCPLYLMVIAPPASGKGVLSFSRNYLWKIEEKFNSNYHSLLTNYRLKKNQPENSEIIKPVLRKLIIPANSSSAAFMRSLKNSNCEGIIFETEADTLSVTLKNDWGNYSDILRKGFHHEHVTSGRLDELGNIEISEPKLAVLISGTLDQVGGMKLNDPTNGLQSRFLFYLFDNLPYFKDVSPYAEGNSRFDFKILGEEFINIYSFLDSNDHEFRLTRSQWRLFHHWFSTKMNITIKDHNGYAAALISRLGVSAFRILMILSTLRTFENGFPPHPITCADKDLVICHHLMETLFTHSMSVFSLSLQSKDENMSKYIEFLELLPNEKEFSRKEAVELASKLFAERSIDRRLAKLVKNGWLISTRTGVYSKVIR